MFSKKNSLFVNVNDIFILVCQGIRRRCKILSFRMPNIFFLSFLFQLYQYLLTDAKLRNMLDLGPFCGTITFITGLMILILLFYSYMVSRVHFYDEIPFLSEIYIIILFFDDKIFFLEIIFWCNKNHCIFKFREQIVLHSISC